MGDIRLAKTGNGITGVEFCGNGVSPSGHGCDDDVQAKQRRPLVNVRFFPAHMCKGDKKCTWHKEEQKPPEDLKMPKAASAAKGKEDIEEEEEEEEEEAGVKNGNGKKKKKKNESKNVTNIMFLSVILLVLLLALGYYYMYRGKSFSNPSGLGTKSPAETSPARRVSAVFI